MKWLRFLGKRWFLSLIGTAAIAFLVWVLGPLTGFLESPTARGWVVGILFALWALVQIVAAVVARMRNRRLVEQLGRGPEPAPDPSQLASQEEAETLRRRFDDAMGVLKRGEGRRRLGGYWVYELPWYLIIGPPGCGKTTALANSGLRFPLSKELGQDPISGIGGTRNCDWWFTDEAVILDTAGRYATQDSDAVVDSAAWRALLGLLKRHRPRRPINGVLVAMSLSDLLLQAAAEREARARDLRARVQEMYEAFKIRIPVYVVFMKADLVAGFKEFFSDLGREEREQVWGVSFPYDDGRGSAGPTASFPAEHQVLAERLEQRLLTRVQQERDLTSRGLVFNFPRQFSSLQEPVAQFLEAAFAPSRYEVRPLVRGVYFTSSTQTGTPFDRVLSAIATSFNLGRRGPAPFTGTPKSYFVTRLLKDLVIAEAGVAGLDPQLERRRLWMRRGAYAGAAGLALLAAAAWTTSYYGNRGLISEVQVDVASTKEQITRMSRDDRTPLAVLPVLDAARAIRTGYAERDADVPLSLGVGLYQGEMLGSQASLAYDRLLRKVLLPRVILRLEDQIRQGLTDPEYLYDALRIYLMLDDADHYDPHAVQFWITRDWELNLPRETTEEQRTALIGHLSALLEERPAPLPLALDQQLVELARATLNNLPLDTRIYARLQVAGVDKGIREFTIAQAGGEYAQLVLTRRSGKPLTEGIPALFTYKGYHEGFMPALAGQIVAASEEAWVLGPQARIVPGTDEAARLIEDVRARYLEDYVRHWQELLDDLGLSSARDTTHAAEIARILADPKDSPLRLLLAAAAQETELDREPEEDKVAAAAAAGALKAAGSALGGLRQRVQRYFGDAIAAYQAEDGAPPEAYVSTRFAWLRKLVSGSEGGPAPIDDIQQQLGQLSQKLRSVAVADATGRGVLSAAEGKEIEELRLSAAQMPEPVAGVVAALAQDSATLVAGGARARINAIWTSQVLPFCREAISNRYPFVQGTRREATPFDFGNMFGPGGRLDTFFNEHLSPIVDTSRRTWRWAGGGIGIDDSVLSQFQRAATIREAFFAGGGKLPAVVFELEPRQMDAEVKQLILNIGGQVLDYRHGPAKAQQMQWPPPEGISRARLVLVDLNGRESGVTEEGAWAWYRLLDRSSLRATGQEELFHVRFTAGGRWAELILRAASVRNPFQLQELRAFRCPERL